MFGWLFGSSEPPKPRPPARKRRARVKRILMVRTRYVSVPETATRTIESLERRGWRRKNQRKF